MNNTRRKEIKVLKEKIQSFLDEELNGKAEELRVEEEEYKDNMPENLQESEKYSVAEDNEEHLSNAYDSIDEAYDSLAEAIEFLDEID